MKKVAKKAVHHAKKHKYKIIIGTPIIFALFVNVEMTTPVYTLSLTSQESIFTSVNDISTIDVVLHADDTINATGATLNLDSSFFEIQSVSMENSIIDLWAQKPTEKDITFAGGITSTELFSGTGNVFTFTTKALQEGISTISFVNPEILANDGKGTNLLTQKTDITFYIRKESLPSPDVNNDGKISLMDINIVYFNTLKKDNPRYDLNGDGTVSLGDVRYLLSLM